MKFIAFDIWGRFAHFRKFYTNSSSLTYGIPPRTTVAGLVAAILGYERDSYYEKFNTDNFMVAVEKLSRTKKILQTLNYTRATSIRELILAKDHTQVPFEVLSGSDNVKFRIYINHKDDLISDEIERRLKNKLFIYPPYLGSASFGCNIEYLGTFGFEEVEIKDYISIDSVIKTDDIEDIRIESYKGKLIKERMPADFSKGRKINRVNSYIYDDMGKGLEVKFNDKIIRLSNDKYITIM